MIMDREVNLTLGYFTKSLQRDEHMTSSYVYYSSSMIWVIPPGHQISSLAKLLKPFQMEVWVGFSAVLASAFAVVLFLKSRSENLQNFVFGQGISAPGLNIVTIVLDGSIARTPDRNFPRTILAVFMIYCFIVQNAYKGGLFKFMQMTVRENAISDTDELIAKKFTFHLLTSSRVRVSELPKILAYSKFGDYENFGQLYNEALNPDFKGALLTSSEHLAYRNIKNYPDRYFNHAPEVVFKSNLVIYFVKDSCFKRQVDQLIIRLLNGGFLSQWASLFIDKNFLKQQEAKQALPLNFEHLKGCFQVFMAGLTVSCVVFVVEMLLKHKRCLIAAVVKR